jgi:hypothetical protein
MMAGHQFNDSTVHHPDPDHKTFLLIVISNRCNVICLSYIGK